MAEMGPDSKTDSSSSNPGATEESQVENLRRVVERLTRELDKANSEKEEAARYGMGLLNEKKALALKFDELEESYENTKHELTIVQEVSNIMQR